MKRIFLYTAVLLVLFSCKKNSENCLKEVPISLQYSIAPGNATANSSFEIILGVTGSDLCWKYLRTDIKVLSNNVIELRPIANYPCTAGICPQAIYEASDTITISTTNPGTYRVDIYSLNTLIASNNVIVN